MKKLKQKPLFMFLENRHKDENIQVTCHGIQKLDIEATSGENESIYISVVILRPYLCHFSHKNRAQ